jgi:LysR family hydrogen peroxide-inducible transcriptional activator
LPQAIDILRQWNQIPSILNSARDGVSGRLRVGCIPTVMPYYLAPKLGEFIDRYPDVSLQLLEEKTARLVDLLQGGELDLAIVGLPLRNPDIVCSELFREPILVAVGKGHRLEGMPKVSLADIASERLLLLKEGHCFRENALTLCSRARPSFVPVFETDQFSSIFSLIGGHFGISLIPKMAAGPDTGCSYLPLEKEAVRRIGYIRARHHVVSASQKAFVGWLRGLK